MLLPEGISTRSLFLWHQISDWDPFNLNATPKLHLPGNFRTILSHTIHNPRQGKALTIISGCGNINIRCTFYFFSVFRRPLKGRECEGPEYAQQIGFDN